MTFSEYYQKKIDIIATQIDKKGKLFDFTMSDGKKFDNVKNIKEVRGGKSGDNVVMIEIENQQYVLKIFSVGNRNKLIMNAKEIDIHKKVMNLFDNDYKEQNYMMCPLLYCYGYIEEIEYKEDKESHSGGFLRYVIMELVTPTYELYTHVEKKCKIESMMYDLNLEHILLQIFYFIGKMVLSGLTHCDLHLKNILIVPQKFVTSFLEISNTDLKITSDYCIKVIDFGLSEENDMLCSKIRKTSSSLNELIDICSGDPYTFDLILGELGLLGDSHSDLNFLCNIIYIFSLIDPRFKKIDLDSIKKNSEIIINMKGEIYFLISYLVLISVSQEM